MSESILRVGVLASTSGSYGTVGKTMENGVKIALEELRDLRPNVKFDVVFANPASDNVEYVNAAKQMLHSGIRHIIGGYTSSSRKKLLPLLERHDALLWFPAHYEGFESSENVVYTGTAPNQHIHPMVDYMYKNHGKSAFCIGSDYIWAWESNRVFKDEFVSRGGSILGEKYVPIDSLNIEDIVDLIVKLKPAFVLNTLIGASSYQFYRQLRQACKKAGIDQVRQIPVVSCTFSEADLMEIGTEACDGHYSSSVYFASVTTDVNKKFVAAYRKKYPNECLPTVEAEAMYIATHFLAAGVELTDVETANNNINALKQAALSYSFNAPQGLVKLDPVTFHTYLTPRIGRSTSKGDFVIVKDYSEPLRPDPYLVKASDEYMLHVDTVMVG